MNTSNPLKEQTLALAGVAQAARIVDQLSRTGTYPVEYLEASLHSLFSFDAEDVEGVFGNIQGIKLGLQNLAAGLAHGDDETSGTMMRYFLSILHLEGKFAARGDLQQVVHNRLQHSSYKAAHFSSQSKAICHSVAAVYSDTLSTLPFRIKIMGSAQHLQNEGNAEMIRALLLCGVRSAFLWRQLGGRRWKLTFQRGRIRTTALELCREVGIR
ncbi:MAG: high frequency lysogenization protein HflD [Halieaceae bacterium]|jgi:high frequency lysogenization protein|nr:high frequency lysogenization protein HflD [Halieaceae bacterium]MDG1492293.1 high frequency lysogenization protein HflD [Luminiphilus sp.]MBT4854086.1 high frequency lysogenization protein HflD [Halieaceae bacterium]MBT6332304.1 high frequency lysogenization protein HflD [Halieaceae bacterium]MBT7341855.1 high frequency lysogenization protein HflD [Halieaceae bacterium]